MAAEATNHARRAGRSTLRVQRPAAEHDRESCRFLRDHRGLPATRLRSFGGRERPRFLHMPRELEDDRLILIHGREATVGDG